MDRKTGQAAAPYRFAIAIVILLAAIGLDQVVKYMTRAAFQPGESKTLVEGLLSLTYVMNRGAAFGVLSGRYHFLVIFPLLVSLGILAVALAARLPVPVRIAMVFIAAGGISNALDRIILGYVTDMIAVSFFPPVFNVADIYVTVGCTCLAILVLFTKEDDYRKEAQP